MHTQVNTFSFKFIEKARTWSLDIYCLANTLIRQRTQQLLVFKKWIKLARKSEGHVLELQCCAKLTLKASTPSAGREKRGTGDLRCDDRWCGCKLYRREGINTDMLAANTEKWVPCILNYELISTSATVFHTHAHPRPPRTSICFFSDLSLTHEAIVSHLIGPFLLLLYSSLSALSLPAKIFFFLRLVISVKAF